MMRTLKCKSFEIGYLEEKEVHCVDAGQLEFTIAKADYLNTDRIKELRTSGYRFHDRILRAEIDVRKEMALDQERLIRFPVVVDSEYSEDVFQLACEAYKTDRRFHLKEGYDQELADEVIRSYIFECKKENMEIVRCIKDDITLGIIIFKDNGNGTADNVLGAVRSNLQGKMAAYGLYMQTLMLMKERGFVKYYGDISSSNIASLNLHIALGAKMVAVSDEYILQRGTD